MRMYRHTQSGFTLIEIMVAFAIAALLIGVTTPAMVKMYDSMKYRDAVRSVVSAIHATRHAAMTRGKIVDFVINPEFRQFQSGNGDIKELDKTIEVMAQTAREVNRGGNAVIRFYPDGSASGGRIDIVYQKGNGVRLRVDWLLGKLTQEVYEPS